MFSACFHGDGTVQCTLSSSLHKDLDVFSFSLILLHEQEFDSERLRSQVEHMGNKEWRSLGEQDFPHAHKKWIQRDSWGLLAGMTISNTFWTCHDGPLVVG